MDGARGLTPAWISRLFAHLDFFYEGFKSILNAKTSPSFWKRDIEISVKRLELGIMNII